MSEENVEELRESMEELADVMRPVFESFAEILGIIIEPLKVVAEVLKDSIYSACGFSREDIEFIEGSPPFAEGGIVSSEVAGRLRIGNGDRETVIISTPHPPSSFLELIARRHFSAPFNLAMFELIGETAENGAAIEINSQPFNDILDSLRMSMDVLNPSSPGKTKRYKEMTEKYPHVCFKCHKTLLYAHALSEAKKEKMNEEDFKNLWILEGIEFFCCTCFKEENEAKIKAEREVATERCIQKNLKKINDLGYNFETLDDFVELQNTDLSKYKKILYEFNPSYFIRKCSKCNAPAYIDERLYINCRDCKFVISVRELDEIQRKLKKRDRLKKRLKGIKIRRNYKR